MASEVLNANPTIRNAADLPSRRHHDPPPTNVTTSSLACSPTPAYHKSTLGLFSNTIPPSAYTPDPFASDVSPLSTSPSDSTPATSPGGDGDHGGPEDIDEQEIYDLIAPISDPEHPLTLGSLSVVNLPDITLRPLSPGSPISIVTVDITPTITHCSLATVIGLGVRVRLEQSLPARFRVDVRIKEGTHSTAEQVNRQLSDKERVAAAMENGTLMGVLKKMLEGCSLSPTGVDQDEDAKAPMDYA